MLGFSAVSECPVSYAASAQAEGVALISVDLGIAYAIDAVQLASVDYTLAYVVDVSQLVSADYSLSYAISASPLVSAQYAISYAIESGQAGPLPDGQADISKVSAARIVVFEGSGTRLEFGQMTAKPAYKVGDKWLCDRDPDEKSRYAADITEELSDRKTTPAPDGIELVLAGVASLEQPTLQVASINGEPRTFVIGFLGPAEGPLPPNWGWAARVTCANGERFDKTTYFNKKDT